MNLDEIRDTLFQSMEEQKAADLAANETNYRLGQQKIMYNNDARGTLYSGQPTWERANLAAENLENIAKIDQSYMDKKLDIWNNITNTLDQINSYNKAAQTMLAAANKYNSSAGKVGTVSSGMSLSELYESLGGND